jgi:predicted DCC family thiol-disulfide oxidoreductase YuxK
MLRRPALPDPNTRAGTDVVIYDGQCNFCIGQVRNLRRLDIGGNRLTFLSLHDPRVAERYPSLSYDDLMARMYVIDPSGNHHGGSEAVKYLSRRLPILWPAMPILHLPGTAGLWRWLYNQVAMRRYKLAGKKSCENDACSVHLK